MATKTRHLLGNLVIIVWVVGLCALGVRALIAEDARYGFGMFAHKVRYEVEYFWVYDDGREEPYVPGRELKGRTQVRLTPGKSLTSHYATGAMKSWVGGYVEYMYSHHAPPASRAFKAVVVHQIVGRAESKTWVVTAPHQSSAAQ